MTSAVRSQMVDPARRHRPYPRYKDTGFEWLGEIPEHWRLLQIKRLSLVKRGASPRPIDDPEYFDEEGKYAWVRIADVTASKRYLEETTQRLSPLGKSLSVPLEPGSLFLSIAGSVGKPIITRIKCCIHDGFVYFPQFRGNSEFLYYIFASGQPYGGLGKLGTQLNLNTDTVGAIHVGYPDNEEQAKLAAFLDRETARIDVLIEKKERQTELLQEKRAAVISHAVTKGLDPSVKMKDSGIEWLGEIPAHWNVLAIKRITSVPITDGPHETPELLDEGVPFISAEAIKNDRIDFDKKRGFISPEEHARFSKKYRPQRGDIYLIKSGATTGNVAFVDTDDEFNIWSPLAAIRPDRKKALTLFVFFFMKSRNFFKSIELGWSYGTQENIGMNVIENIPIALPLLEEQQSIATFLWEETAGIDSLVSKVELSISMLREYRTALITAAVTGKIDVRKEVA